MSVTAAALRAEGIATQAITTSPTLTLDNALRPALFSLVGMFFALSGFLVTGSAFRNPKVKVFFANRALRILPALTVDQASVLVQLGLLNPAGLPVGGVEVARRVRDPSLAARVY